MDTPQTVGLIIAAIIAGTVIVFAAIGCLRGEHPGPDLLALKFELMAAENAQRHELLNLGFHEDYLCDHSRVISDRRTGLPTISYRISAVEIDHAAESLMRRLAEAHSAGINHPAAASVRR